jgi:tryptophan synthase alpha subunit
MEDAQRTYTSHDDEFIYLYVSLGVDGTESKEECINLVETIKELQKYFQSYKVDNGRLMKSKEQQDDFNINLMQILDRI